MDFEPLRIGIIGKGDARVGAHQSPWGFDVRVDVNGLLEIEATVHAPMQAMDDVVSVFGAESAQHDAALAEQSIGSGFAEVEKFCARADETAAFGVWGDAGGNEQFVRDNAGDIRHAVAVGVLEEDDAIISGRGTKLRRIPFHHGPEIVRIDLWIGVGSGHPQSPVGIPAHADRFFQKWIFSVAGHFQARVHGEIWAWQRWNDGQFGFAWRFGGQGAGLTCGDGDDIGLGFVDEWVELGDFYGVASLFAFPEAEDVRIISGAAAVKKEGVFPQDGLTEKLLRWGFGVPCGGFRLPAQLGGHAGAEGAKPLWGQVDAVVCALREIDACGLFPFTADERGLFFRGELFDHFFVLGQQGVVPGGVGQARPGAAHVFVSNRSDKNKTHAPAGAGLFD